MKKLLLNGVIFLGLIAVLIGCRSECKQTLYYTANVPVYASKASIRDAVTVETSLAVDSVAEMLSYKETLFLRNGTDGIHVIDNTDPSNPDNHAYIKIVPCFAMETNDDQLYVIQGTDLVVFDLSDVRNPVVKHRVNDLYNSDFAKGDSFVVGYEQQEVVKVLNDFSCSDQFIFPEDEVIRGAISTPHGQITVHKDHIYTADNQSVVTLALNGSAAPGFTSRMAAFNNIPDARLYILLDSILLFGTGSGLMALDITTNPASPVNTGGFFPAGGCNPIAIWDSLTFAPMFNDLQEDESFCFSNPMISVVDVVTRRPISRVTGYSQPYYMHYHNNRVLLCNGFEGFRIFGVQDRILLSDYIDNSGESNNVHARLGMLFGENNVLVYGNNGVFQYDISDRTIVKKLSEIK